MQPWTQRIQYDGDDPAFDDYIDACEDYLKRQLLVYENWPQEKYSSLGYTGEKVFVDRNA